MQKKEQFTDKFSRLVQSPLEESDPDSFNRINSLFDNEEADHNNPFAYLIKKISGKSYPEGKAESHWCKILENKAEMEAKLGRMVSIQTAAVDYFSTRGKPSKAKETTKEPEKQKGVSENDQWLMKVYSPSLYQDKLKEEISRARRYNHALSGVLLDVDQFHKINEDFSFKTGDEILTLIVKIIKKTIRNVDILARYSGDQFLIILPNTNQREAVELAERIRQNVHERTSRLHNLAHGITVTLSVRQCAGDEKASGFISNIEGTLKIGKQHGRNAVYTPEEVSSPSFG